MLRACKRAGVATFNPYAIRHAFRVRISRAVGTEEARILMGHRSIDMTAHYGAGSDGDLAADAARKAG
mgnify:CR=1 FL=1